MVGLILCGFGLVVLILRWGGCFGCLFWVFRLFVVVFGWWVVVIIMYVIIRYVALFGLMLFLFCFFCWLCVGCCGLFVFCEFAGGWGLLFR